VLLNVMEDRLVHVVQLHSEFVRARPEASESGDRRNRDAASVD